MAARLIAFFIDVSDEGNRRGLNELMDEHPGWVHISGGPISETGTVVLPNMSFECAEVVDEWLKEKGIERTWLTNDEPEYKKYIG